MNQNSEVKSSKKGTVKKVLIIILLILLMIGISFVVANIVHKSGSSPASATVKDGLSAYEIAVQYGYDGSVEEWLDSLSGKSAYEIAVENGYSGTENDWELLLLLLPIKIT